MSIHVGIVVLALGDTNDTTSAKGAVEWLTKAANQGNENAQFFLGQCYQVGTGVQPDLVEAYKWTLLANRGKENPWIPEDLRDKLSAKQMREGIERAQAFVPHTNAVTFKGRPMPDWIEHRVAPSAAGQ
jgi:Sel1 repeat